MNSTAEHVGWVAEPAGRGTFGLLISCATTIFLCTYSAVHPNLPSLNDTACSIQLRKISYMLACIVGPEFFSLFAIFAYFDARALQRKVGVCITRSDDIGEIRANRSLSLEQYCHCEVKEYLGAEALFLCCYALTLWTCPITVYL